MPAPILAQTGPRETILTPSPHRQPARSRRLPGECPFRNPSRLPRDGLHSLHACKFEETAESSPQPTPRSLQRTLEQPPTGPPRDATKTRSAVAKNPSPDWWNPAPVPLCPLAFPLSTFLSSSGASSASRRRSSAVSVLRISKPVAQHSFRLRP